MVQHKGKALAALVSLNGAPTAVATTLLSNAPQGPRLAAQQTLAQLADDTGDAMIRHAARYLYSDAGRGAPLRELSAWEQALLDEAKKLVTEGSTPEDAAKSVAENSSSNRRVRWNVSKLLLRRLLMK
jgi:hypothetical protein